MEEQTSYFYYFPPYPIPAQNQIRTAIYWDVNLNIDNAEIELIDILGNVVSSKSKYTLIKESNWNGTLIWDCSEIPNGVYLIKVKQENGNKIYTIPVVVAK